jgi:hypothetical protein
MYIDSAAQTAATAAAIRTYAASLAGHYFRCASRPRQVELAIQKDAKTPEVIDPVKKSFGPAVKDWMRRMVGKAIDTSWNIEVGVAGGLLANALQTYHFS